MTLLSCFLNNGAHIFYLYWASYITRSAMIPKKEINSVSLPPHCALSQQIATKASIFWKENPQQYFSELEWGEPSHAQSEMALTKSLRPWI